MPRFDHIPKNRLAPASNGATKSFEAFALALCASYPPLPEVNAPFGAKSISWEGSTYVYVFGWDFAGRRRLLEVFRDRQGALEPLLAFQYPIPFRELFPQDFDMLYSDDPWGEGTIGAATT